MSDTQTPAAPAPTTPPAAPAATAAPPATPPTPDAKGADTWDDGTPFDATKARSLIDKLRGQVTDLEPLAKKAKELEDAGKSEVERATGRATTAEGERDEAKGYALRLEVALEQGLTITQAKRLVGKTKAELEADARDLIESFGGGKGDAAPHTQRRPGERLRPGSVPDATDQPHDPAKIVASIPRSRF